MPKREFYQKYKEKMREYNRIYLKQWRERTGRYGERDGYRDTPEAKIRIIARRKVNNAIATGKLTRQNCENKGCDVTGEAHHEDYNLPMEIRWLCKLHHAEYHTK